MPPEEDDAESSNDAGDVRVGIVPQEHVQAVALARAKAVAVRHADALVLAVEQVRRWRRRDAVPHGSSRAQSVFVDGKMLLKPTKPSQAYEMLQMLSGKVHQVITGVCLFYKQQYHSFYDVSEVTFRDMNHEELNHYVNKYKPMDKAGSYGIQEWVGVTGIKKINGSYTNVVGLPTERLYEELVKLTR
jgi:MAF protein